MLLSTFAVISFMDGFLPSAYSTHPTYYLSQSLYTLLNQLMSSTTCMTNRPHPFCHWNKSSCTSVHSSVSIRSRGLWRGTGIRCNVLSQSRSLNTVEKTFIHIVGTMVVWCWCWLYWTIFKSSLFIPLMSTTVCSVAQLVVVAPVLLLSWALGVFSGCTRFHPHFIGIITPINLQFSCVSMSRITGNGRQVPITDALLPCWVFLQSLQGQPFLKFTFYKLFYL